MPPQVVVLRGTHAFPDETQYNSALICCGTKLGLLWDVCTLCQMISFPVNEVLYVSFCHQRCFAIPDFTNVVHYLEQNKTKIYTKDFMPIKAKSISDNDLANRSFCSFLYNSSLKTEFCKMSSLTFSQQFCTMQCYQKAQLVYRG